MADPTQKVRSGTYERDGFACAACGRTDTLTFQHRRAVGMGGSKVRPSYSDGLAACALCNARFEADLQDQALLNGWKVRGWVDDPARVPYFHTVTGRWYVLSTDSPVRVAISATVALAMMRDVYGPDFLRGGAL